MYLILSAALWIIPYIYPSLAPLLFISLTPLIYQSLLSERKKSFLQGVLWGSIVFSVLFYWCLQMLFGYKLTIITVIFWLCAVLWYALFAGIWFWMQPKLQVLLHNPRISNDFGFILSWLLCAVLFIYFITYGSLCFGGVIEGYPFFNPFLICAHYPAMIWCLAYIGCLGGLIFFVGLQVFAVLGFVKDKRYLALALVCCIPFLIGFIKDTQKKDFAVGQGYFITPWWSTSKEPMFSGYRMVSEVAKAVRENQEVKFICMPESTFNWDIHEYYQFIEIMGQDAPGVCIGFGGHHRSDTVLKSSFFVVKDGQKIFEYDKRHLIPLMERSSQVLTWLGLKQMLNQDEFFAYGSSDQNDIVEINGVLYQVFICSEFFFEAKRIKGVPVLFVCNDAWLTCNYAKRWVDLSVAYFSICHTVPVVYGTVCGKTNIKAY